MDNSSLPINTVAFWGAGATASLGMATTAEQNKIFLSLSQKKHGESYWDCLGSHRDTFGDCFDDVCDLLTLLDDDVDDADSAHKKIGYRMSGFSDRQTRIISKHVADLGPEDKIRHNRVIMMRLRYDWAAAMRILRLQRYNTEKDKGGNVVPSSTFTQSIYNLLDANIAAGTGIHVFDDVDSELSNFLDVVRLRSAKAALVMFINLMFASAWAKKRTDGKLSAYARFGDSLAAIRAEEAHESCLERSFPDSVFRTSFVSMNFDPILWWIIKNADARYNKDPIYIGKENAPLYLGEDFDQVDEVRKFRVQSPDGQDVPSVSDEVLPEVAARFANERSTNINERCLARYQTVKIFFPHGSPNLKICPCCGKTTLYQGNGLTDASESLFPPFFFKKLTWGCQSVDALRGDTDAYSEDKKWQEGELDYIQCRHCGRAIRMCDTEMVMQSGLKTPPSYLLQRISHNVDNAVMGATHIVLMGYSLPPDDGAWVAELQARTTREQMGTICCSVLGYLERAPSRWLYDDELVEYVSKCKVIENACKVFGQSRVRANLLGIPNVFDSENSVKEILYPIEWLTKLRSDET